MNDNELKIYESPDNLKILTLLEFQVKPTGLRMLFRHKSKIRARNIIVNNVILILEQTLFQLDAFAY